MALSNSGANPATGPAAEIDPSALEAVKTLIQTGDLPQARTRAEALLKAHPENAQLCNMLGIIALSSGEPAKAEGYLQDALRLQPGFTSAAANLGVALMQQKKTVAAVAVLRDAIEADPRAAQVRTNLANAYLNNQQFQEAFDQSTELLKLAPDHAPFLKIRATAAVEFGDWDTVHDALDKIERATSVDGWSVGVRFKALSNSDRADEAVAFGETKATAFPTIMTPLANLLAELGRFEESREWLRKALQHNPDDAIAYFHYGKSQRWDAEDPMLDALQAATERFAQNDQYDAAAAFFAMAKANMDLKRYDAVFPMLNKGNEFQGREWRYDLDKQAEQAREIRKNWTAQSIAELSSSGDKSVHPIFIVGMPRSGSTLTEHVIEAHPEVTSVGEGSQTGPFFPARMPAEHAEIAKSTEAASEVIRKLAGPKGRLLDKYLFNYQRLGSLAAAFPNARFIQTRRDPRAIALSIYSNPLSVEQHAYSTNLRDLAQFYVQYHRLMDYWKDVLGDRVIVSNYQTLVEDPEPNIRDLIARLDLPWNDACLKPEAVQKRVRTLSVVQVRSGIHAGSVERWRHYEAELQPFTDIVSKVWDFDAG